MRPEIPWNVAGIPSEAREAARAAARREGLSVGEWMTRRILRSFSDGSDDMTLAREQWSATSGGGYAQQTEPRPAPRHDTEEMLARVARSGSESSDIYRRIEEQLRNVARRLESSERSQFENNRAMSQAATEINVVAREQAQAFGQLGGSVVSLADRLERVERLAAHEGTREAIKGLHLGLTRLADQISTTANQSASQISTLAANMEALAGRLAQARSEGQAATRGLDDRIAQLDQRVAKVSAIDERLRAVERNAETAAGAISQALQSIEARREDDAIARHRETETAGAIARLEDNVAKLEARSSDPAIDSRLSGIERSLAEIAGRLDAPPQTDAIEDSIRHLAERVEAAETRQRDQIADIAGRLDASAQNGVIEDNIKRLAQRLEVAESHQRAQIAELQAAVEEASSRLASVESAQQPFTLGEEAVLPAPQPSEAAALPTAQPSIDAAAVPEATPQKPVEQTVAEPTTAENLHSAEPASAGAAAQTAEDNNLAASGTSASAPTPVADSYLSAARRSARAAAAQAEAERPNHIGAFRWGGPTAEAPAEPVISSDPADSKEPGTSKKKTHIWIGLIIVFVVLAIAAGFVLSRKMSATAPHAASGLFSKSATSPLPPPKRRTSSHASSALTGSVIPTTPATATPPAKAVATPAAPPATTVNKPNAQIIPSAVVKPTSAPPAKPSSAEAITTVPVTFLAPPAKPQPQATLVPAKPQAALTPLDRLTQLANAGNARAELVVGLKYLDGDGVPVNEANAAKWLERAAQQGLPVAQYRLGTLYDRGRGVPTDAAKAVHWYQLAAQAGNRKAMHNLAVAYSAGNGIAKNMAEAARWFSKAAALGLADSEFNLAVLYERGLGVPQSLLDAYKWYAIAAANGDAESKARIDALATQLTGDVRAAAQHAADTFHAQPLDARANVAPSLNDIAGH
jgi:localization factor PodJL